jgi:poly(3-hydroxybutyrate) depolymerase
MRVSFFNNYFTRSFGLRSNKTRPLVANALLMSALGTAVPALAQTFSVSPGNVVLVGVPLEIKLTGLLPNAKVTLRSERMIGVGAARKLWRAEASFDASANGEISLNRDAPALAATGAPNSYSGADVRGLFWCATPVTNTSVNTADSQVRLTALIDERVVASTQITLLRLRADVQTRDVDAFPGAKYSTLSVRENSTKQRPAVILLGGSEGDDSMSDMAAYLASHGYAALSLPYYSPPQWGAQGMVPSKFPTLPSSFADIPIDRLEAAREWLSQQPRVDTSRIALYGVSKGAEFSLIAASKMPWVTAVVAIVPSDVVWEGWGGAVEKENTRSSFSWNGAPLPFLPYKGMNEEFSKMQNGGAVRIRTPHDAGRATFPDRIAAARIPIESFKGAVLVAGGDDDALWDSSSMAKNIGVARSKASLESVVLTFAQAGHSLSGGGWAPTTQHNDGPFKTGGTAQADARAQAAIRNHVMAFLAKHLRADSAH